MECPSDHPLYNGASLTSLNMTALESFGAVQTGGLIPRCLELDNTNVVAGEEVADGSERHDEHRSKLTLSTSGPA